MAEARPKSASTGCLPDKQLQIISGSNFSGRSAYLRTVTGVDPPYKSSRENPVYLGPEGESALSGLSLSVEHELILHHGGPDYRIALQELWGELGLQRLLHQSPATLSGGGMAKLVLASAVLLEPDLLAIDCTLEQVDLQVRRNLIKRIENVLRGTPILLADNRLSEIGLAGVGEAPCSPGVPPAETLRAELLPTPERVPTNLAFEELRFSYPRSAQPVLNGASASLEAGHVYYLHGANGAGKSTLAKILCGAIRPESGTMWLNGTQYRPWAVGNRALSYHFQNPDRGRARQRLMDDLLAGVQFLSKKTGDEDRKRCESIASAFGLSKLVGENVDLFPYVVRKRAGLAAALAPIAPWYFFDEPSLGQDDSSVKELCTMFRKLARAGAGVVIVTHARSLVANLKGRHLRLEGGRLT